MILAEKSQCVWRHVGNGKDRFEIKLRSPSYEDRLTHQSIQTSYAIADTRDRMQIDRERIDWCLGFAEDWREVHGESGELVPFSRDNLTLLVVAHPRVMLGIVAQVERLLESELSESQRGN